MTLEILTLNKAQFSIGTMRKERQVKKDDLTDVVYLMPQIPKANMRKTAKDKRKAYLITVLFSALNLR